MFQKGGNRDPAGTSAARITIAYAGPIGTDSAATNFRGIRVVVSPMPSPCQHSDHSQAVASGPRGPLWDGRREGGGAREYIIEADAYYWTKISDGHVPDGVYDEARHHFSEKELVDLTAAVIAINAWNRAAISFRATPPLKSVKLAA